MRQPNPKSKVIKVRADELKIHPLAQRELVPSNLKRLKTTLDLDAIGVMHAVEYDKRGLLIIDGQHRLHALMDNDFGEWPVEVKIHLDIKNDKEACDKFWKLNKRATVSPYDTFMVEYHAGYPAAMGVYALALKHRLKIARGAADGSLICVSGLKRVFGFDNGKTLDETLTTVTTCWGTKSAALEGKLIEGIGMVFFKCMNSIDRAALEKKLSKYPGGPQALIGNARGMMQHRKTPLSRCIGDLIIDAYNKGRSVGKLDPL